MNNNFIFPTFHFEPAQLSLEVQRLQKKYKHGSQISEEMVLRKLPDLLAQIRKLQNDREVLITFAKGLKSIDINILTSSYPYETEDEVTENKIIVILSERYNSLVGRRFWSHFQHRIKDEKINRMLVHAFKNEDYNFLKLNFAIRENYNKVFSSSDTENVLHQLTTFIGKEKSTIEASFKEYKVEQDSQLANELWLRILETFIKESGFVDLQGEAIIEERLKNIYLERYKSIILSYLNAHDYSAYHANLFTQVMERLKDPRVDMQHWDDVAETIVQKVKMYLNEKDLHSFFGENDYERFNYWKRYIRFVEDINLVEDPPIAAMYFKDFVVVEFAKKGNAAYFYEREGFNKYLLFKMKIYMREESLKDTEADYFIHKINHAGHWPARYDKYMANYLRGNFNYSHNY